MFNCLHIWESSLFKLFWCLISETALRRREKDNILNSLIFGPGTGHIFSPASIPLKRASDGAFIAVDFVFRQHKQATKSRISGLNIIFLKHRCYKTGSRRRQTTEHVFMALFSKLTNLHHHQPVPDMNCMEGFCRSKRTGRLCFLIGSMEVGRWGATNWDSRADSEAERVSFRDWRNTIWNQNHPLCVCQE